jgi:hypothetical protein
MLNESRRMTGRQLDFAPIESLHVSGLAELERDVLPRRTPVLVTGLSETWPALERWTPEYLQGALENELLSVYVSPDRFFPGEFAAPPDGRSKAVDGRRTERMPGKTFLAKWRTAEAARYYVHAFPLSQRLAADIEFEALGRDDIGKFMWLSGEGHVTPTHFDGSHNIFVQVVGTKRVYLFEPPHFDHLYLHGVDHRYSRHSQLFDLENIDFEAYPRASQLRGLTAELGPGSALFIPNFWWHCVHTTSASVSVNFWWNSEPFPRYDELTQYWTTLRQAFFESLPDEMPPRMKAYFLKLLLFTDVR